MQTAEIAAGPTLDALVATKVMRWERTPSGEDWHGRPDWSPSTEIEDAWPLLDGWSVTLSHAVGLPWHCHLMRTERTREGWVNAEGHGDTAPLAICRAVLQAFEHQ